MMQSNKLESFLKHKHPINILKKNHNFPAQTKGYLLPKVLSAMLNSPENKIFKL